MDKPVFSGELEMPQFIKEGYSYLGKDGRRHLRDDAPDWAKKEYKEFYAKLNPEPDEDGVIVQY